MSEKEVNHAEIVMIDVNDESQEIARDATRKKILNEQVKVERTKATYWQLYRFASKLDWLVMVIGTFFAAQYSFVLHYFVCKLTNLHYPYFVIWREYLYVLSWLYQYFL